MIKILITGANGFLGNNIYKSLFLNEEYEIYACSRYSLDLIDIKRLDDHLNYIRPDFIINCAYIGGRRTKEDSVSDFNKNTLIVENLIKLKQYYGKLFLFSSGAVFDRRYSINNKKELNQLEKTYIPIDCYGRAKFFNDLEAVKCQQIINLRIFNCFGNGMPTSAIPTFINNCLQNKPINIWSDFRFSTFYINDLIKVIEHFIQNPPDSYREINICYNKKYYLSQLATKIKLLIGSKSDIIIEEKSKKHYTGNGDRLKELGLNLSGLEQGLLDTIEYFKLNGKE